MLKLKTQAHSRDGCEMYEHTNFVEGVHWTCDTSIEILKCAHEGSEKGKGEASDALATCLWAIGDKGSKMRLRKTDFLTIAVENLRIQ